MVVSNIAVEQPRTAAELAATLRDASAAGKAVTFQTGYVNKGKSQYLAVRFPNPGEFPYRSLGGPTELTGTFVVH